METSHGHEVAAARATGSPLAVGAEVSSSGDPDGYSGGSEGDSDSSGLAPEAASEATGPSPDGVVPPLQRRPRPDLPPYGPVLCLSTETYQLSGVEAADLLPNYPERLKTAVWYHTGRHLVGACVRLGPGGSCHVVLDMVELQLDGTSGGTGASGTGAHPALAGSRRLLASSAGEKRKATLNAGGASASASVSSGPRWLEDLPPDAELGVPHLRSALLLQPWWQDGAFLSWLVEDVCLRLAAAAAAVLLRVWASIWLPCSDGIRRVAGRAEATFRAVPWPRWAQRMGLGAAAAAAILLRVWDDMWTDDRHRPGVRASGRDCAGWGTDDGSHGAAASTAAARGDCSDWGSLGRVVGRRITAVGPRVMLAGEQARRNPHGNDHQPHSQDTSGAGAGAREGAGTAWVPRFEVTVSACCSGRPGGDGVRGSGSCGTQAPGGGGGTGSGGGAADSGERGSGGSCGRRRTSGRGPGLRLLLRHGFGYGSTSVVRVDPQAHDAAEAAGTGGAGGSPAAATSGAPSAAAAARTCRRALCRRHLTLRHDVDLPECRNESAPSCAGCSRAQPLRAEQLDPGLLLLDIVAPDPVQSSAVQPPVPVLVLDNPRVVEELRPVLADRQVWSGSAANLDDLLVDMGVFVQHVAALRRLAAPVLAFVEGGGLRGGGRVPPCCCCCCRDQRNRDGASCCPASCGPAGPAGQTGTGSPAAGPHGAGGGVGATTSGTQGPAVITQPGGLSSTAPGDPPTAPPCVACQVLCLQDLAGSDCWTSTFMLVGECLLRYATSAGWVHTAALLASNLAELQRIGVLTDALEAKTPERKDAAAKTTPEAGAGKHAESCDGGSGGRGRSAAAAPAAALTLWRTTKSLLIRFVSPLWRVLSVSRFAVGLHLVIMSLVHWLVGLAARLQVGPPWGPLLDGLPRLVLSAVLACVPVGALLGHAGAGAGGCGAGGGGSGRSGAPGRARTGGRRVRLWART